MILEKNKNGKIPSKCQETNEVCERDAEIESPFCNVHSTCYTYDTDNVSRCPFPRCKNENDRIWTQFCQDHIDLGADEYAEFLYLIKENERCRVSLNNRCYKSKNCHKIHQWLVTCQTLTKLIYERLYHPEVQGWSHGQYLGRYTTAIKDCRRFCPLDDKTSDLIANLRRTWYNKRSSIRKRRQRKGTGKKSKR